MYVHVCTWIDTVQSNYNFIIMRYHGYHAWLHQKSCHVPQHGSACLTSTPQPVTSVKAYSFHSFPGQGLFLSAWAFLVIVSLCLISGRLAFLHDGYIATIENCCVPMVVKRTLFTMRIVSLLLGTSFNMIFATHIMSLLLGTSFNTKLYLHNFVLEHYS